MSCGDTYTMEAGAGGAGGNGGQISIDQAAQMFARKGNWNRTIFTGGDPEKEKDVALSRGSYKVKSQIEFTGQTPVFIQNQLKAVQVGDEWKRIFFEKIEIKNIRESEGKKTADLITDFTVIDNPIPLVPIVWGAMAIGTGVTGWFVVDKVESFTDTTAGSLITLAATVFGAVLALRYFFK